MQIRGDKVLPILVHVINLMLPERFKRRKEARVKIKYYELFRRQKLLHEELLVAENRA